MQPAAWLSRVRHDLVKRLVWPARDRRDAGGTPVPGELAPRLVDNEGRPATPQDVWADLATDAPPGGDLEAFAAALGRAVAAAGADDVAGVIELEAAFERLARSLDGRS
jgi:hypothetical protein